MTAAADEWEGNGTPKTGSVARWAPVSERERDGEEEEEEECAGEMGAGGEGGGRSDAPDINGREGPPRAARTEGEERRGDVTHHQSRSEWEEEGEGIHE